MEYSPMRLSEIPNEVARPFECEKLNWAAMATRPIAFGKLSCLSGNFDSPKVNLEFKLLSPGILIINFTRTLQQRAVKKSPNVKILRGGTQCV